MSGTNFRSGVSVRRQYSGTDVQGDKSRLDAATKLIRHSAVIHCEASLAPTLTKFTLPAQAIVHNVMLSVLTLEAGVTINVGKLAGNSNDFLALVSIANTGLVMGDLVDGAITLGPLLYEETGVGADVAYARRPDITSGGDTILFQAIGGTEIGRFDIIVEYDEVVNEVQ